ncbi:hypothetical protein [Frankia sp. R82]|uniref:hypothetical protein n=1 Tax=Frankia sp. R82 TaxID=2950553 RepID=UPI002043AB62|nr:hypothetical protein [Frankia sp. R82]MCM3886984.1 hypothetical protein [Frankia sp. R82]
MPLYANTPANQAAVVNAIGAWFGRAQNLIINAHTSAWLQWSHANVVFYNCGGIGGANGFGYGVDYVDDNLYNWLSNNLAGQLPGYAIQPFPGYRASGPIGVNGHRRWAQDYFNITRLANNNQAIAANTHPAIPGGNYRVILNFHLYVGGQYANPAYQAPPPPPGPGGGAPAANLSVAANPDQWPTL